MLTKATFFKTLLLGTWALFALSGCMRGKSKESNVMIDYQSIYSSFSGSGQSHGRFPSRGVPRCRFVNPKTAKTTVRLGFPAEFQNPQDWDPATGSYLLVEYSRDMCGLGSGLKVNYRNSGYASQDTNYTSSIDADKLGRSTHCDLLSQGEMPASQIKVGQIVQFPIPYSRVTAAVLEEPMSIFIQFKVTAVEPATSAADAQQANKQLCDGKQVRDPIRVKGHFFPLGIRRYWGAYEQYVSNLLEMFGKEGGRGLPVFLPFPTTGGDVTIVGQEEPGVHVGFLKKTIQPAILINGYKKGEIANPSIDFINGGVYKLDDKTEFYLTVGNSCKVLADMSSGSPI